MPSLTPELRSEYERLFSQCQIRPERRAAVERIADRAQENAARYRAVADPRGLPWTVIAAIHNLESSQSFTRHLHNGDPLTARTRQVPAGRPLDGQPPFTWEFSARDALTLQKLDGLDDWSLPASLYRLEAYNGWGYRNHHPETLSPYLWSFSSLYRSGKYVADGRWDATAVSGQCGAAVLLRRFAERGLLDFLPAPAAAPEIPQPVRYALRKPREPAEYARAVALQKWLNTQPGIFLRVDGVCGEKTSRAWKTVTGAWLPGDPRGA